MPGTYRTGDTAYLLESNRAVRRVLIKKVTGDFYTVTFPDTGGAIRISGRRLYPTKDEAEEAKKTEN